MVPANADDWTRAALDALEEGGVAAVAIEPVARRLGVTKGSGYWHFRDRAALLAAVLDRWVAQSVDAPLAELAGVEDPAERLRGLFARGTGKAPSIFVRLLDATAEPAVREAVRVAAQRRVDFLERAYRDLGLTPARARHRAVLAYATYVGLAHLLRDAPDVLGDPRTLSRHLGEQLLGAG